ncbi:MAG: hypothetical protein Q8P46_03130 [Hyphomicrobiales bacterium]|nr:hypothetical protein [Hyphomicrobiales bacterium]
MTRFAAPDRAKIKTFARCSEASENKSLERAKPACLPEPSHQLSSKKNQNPPCDNARRIYQRKLDHAKQAEVRGAFIDVLLRVVDDCTKVK